ncbi:TraR/DksA C4-type zinc finger protein [Ostreiculturibacter nitratireducens]|uniref:TraR/DksA family transcriptional regulator n=1 Tax=Ostreiculturibacter nitratireducens TaxID=3075226 RepID=UPI0031B5F15A
MKTVAERKAELESRLASLESRMREIDSELESHSSKDWEEMAVERETDEVLEDLGVSAQQEVRMIQAALQRIEEGEYGYCTQCGSEIGEERLDLIPATPFCRNCAPGK